MLNRIIPILTLLVVLLWVIPVRAAVDWTEGFEYANETAMAAVWTSSGGVNGCPGSIAVNTNLAFVHSGTKSIKQTFLGHEVQSCFMDRNLSGPGSTLYTRMWAYIVPGFDVTPISGTKYMNQGEPCCYPSPYWVLGLFGGNSFGVSMQGVYNPGPPPRTETVNHMSSAIPYGSWVCLETRITLSSPGGADGIIQAWINNTMVMDRRNDYMRAPTLLQNNSPSMQFRFVRLYQQHGTGTLYYDDMAVDRTARIGCGSTPPPPDSTPPTVPGAVTATVSGSTASLTIGSASSDPESGVTGYSRYRCAGGSCNPTTSSPVSQSGLTFTDTGLAALTTYGYCYRANNGVGLQSACTATVYVTTPGAETLYFTPLFADPFTRADGTLGANWTGSFTARSDFSLVSNQVRVGSLGAEYLQVYNGTTPNDQYAKGQLVSVGGNGAITPGVNVRMQTGPAVNGVVCQADLVANTSTIRELTNGSYGNITTPYSGWTYAALDYIWCEAEGTAYRMYAERGGIKTLLASGTDATHTSGKVGLSNNVAAGGTGTIEYVGGQTGSFAGTTSAQTIAFALTGGLASTPAADDLVIIHYAIGSNGSATTLAIRNTSAVDYTLFGTQGFADDTVDTERRSAYRVQPGTPETQFVLTSTGGGTGNINDAGTYVVQVFRGVDATILEQAVQQGVGINTHLVDFGSITPTTTGAVVVVVGAGGLETSGAAYTTSGLTAFLSPVGATDAQESSIGAGYVPWVSGPVAPATFSGGGTVHSFNSYSWMLISLKPGGGGAANTTASSQLDNFEMGSISSTQAVPPTITSIAATASTVTVTHGPTVSTHIRVLYGSNTTGSFYNVLHAIADFVDGVLTLPEPMRPGTQYLCARPYDLAGNENTASDASKCLGAATLSPIVDTTDTAPIAFGTAFPTTLPADSASGLYGVPINKSGSCRADTVLRDYVDMDVATTAVQMDVSNLVASTTATGSANGTSYTFYVHCVFENSFGELIYTTTPKTITFSVDTSTVDITHPGKVGTIVAQAIPDSTDIFVTWPEASGGDIDFHRVYTSRDNATYSLAANVDAPETSTTLTGFPPNQLVYVKAEGVDTSGNAGPASDEASVTTSSIPDRTPPPRLTGLRVIGSTFTESALFTWDTKEDDHGPVYTQLRYGIGAGCTPSIALGPKVSGTQLPRDLTPGTDYCVDGIHFDAAGNPSGGLDNPTYSDIVYFTTKTDGLTIPRESRQTHQGAASAARESGTREAR